MKQYPTDQELNRFIEELEQEELYAPAHLKEEILRKLEKNGQSTQDSSRKKAPISFPVYTLKIVAGMAAAILLIFLIPAQNGSNVSRAEILGQPIEALKNENDIIMEDRISLDERISSFLKRNGKQLMNGNKKSVCN